jgi:hypothetical protein
MKKHILPLCSPIGLLIYLVYRIGSHYMAVGDAVAIPAMIISIIFMTIGIAYAGGCMGRRILNICRYSFAYYSLSYIFSIIS